MSRATDSQQPSFPSVRGATLAALGLAAVGIAIDLVTPANLIIAVISGLALVLAASNRDLRFLWGLAITLAVVAVASYWVRAVLAPETALVVLVNRMLAAAATLLIAGVLHLRIRAEQAAERDGQALAKQHEELRALNEELGQREEEIVRQNEELQSQTEELERQSEELRVTNEELAAREKTLEQLLELSRGLTAEVGRDEMLKRICEALGVLNQGVASAMLERHDDRLVLICHHGFGQGGPEVEEFPVNGSFTSLIMARGQTGYLEDVELRPDLKLPRPREGPPFRSVLSSPLRVHNRCRGTIEVYSTQRQTWTDSQIALVESLAVQASISLQSAELVDTIRLERGRFEAVFRTVPFGILVADDPHCQRVRPNPAAAAMFGVPQDENLSPDTPAGARIRRVVSRGDRPVPPEELPLVRAVRGEESQNEEYELTLPGPRRLTLLASAAPILDGKGHVVGGVCGFADVTVLKALQREQDLRRREAEEASVRKTRFLAAVSHDIRTPANAINLMAEVIRRVAVDPAMAGQIPELAQRLQANTRSLVELVSDVLDVARFDSGKMDVQESEFLFNELVAEECRHLQPLAQDKGLRMVVELPDRPVWLRTDRVKLARVIGNLAGNAIKFTDAGTVSVSASLTSDRRPRLRVSDTGRGIAAEHLPRIFDEFAQLRNPERDPTKGTGLGLAICKRLTEVMGGTIEVESEPGRGTTFTVSLPPSCVLLRLDSGPMPPAPPAALGRSSGTALTGLRVLLVEDHATTREGTKQLLGGEGAEVEDAADGAAALRALEHSQFDVVLLDMMMPNVDGREVLRSLQARRPPGLRAVLVLTGDLTPERVEEVRRLGADGLIGKPVDVAKLIAALETVRRTGG